jgi:hypothetical protein
MQLVFGSAAGIFNRAEEGMKSVIALALITGFGLVSAIAYAAPVKLSKDQMDKITAGDCCQRTNGGGNVPGGNANGVPNVNNGGNAPPGKQ